MQTQDEAWDDARTLVAHYTSCGYPRELIAGYLSPSCDIKTLEKYFEFEIANGDAIALAKMENRLYTQAMNGDGANQRFYLGRRGGERWKEKIGFDHNGPIPVQFFPGDDTI